MVVVLLSKASALKVGNRQVPPRVPMSKGVTVRKAALQNPQLRAGQVLGQKQLPIQRL